MIEIVIAALATYGVSKLVSSYDGLYDVFLRLRSKYPNSPLSCAVCTSVWVGIPIAIFTGIGFLGYLAILGIVIITDRLIP